MISTLPIVHCVKEPSACTDGELDAFCSLVREGGQVMLRGLKGRVKRAVALAFVYVNDVLAAVGAIKRPGVAYRGSIFQKAGVSVDPANFPVEVGWVFVSEEYRGKKLSRVPIEVLLPLIAIDNCFATSDVKRIEMHKTLERYGFSKVGKPYKSDQDKDRLQLFLRVVAHPDTLEARGKQRVLGQGRS